MPGHYSLVNKREGRASPLRIVRTYFDFPFAGDNGLSAAAGFGWSLSIVKPWTEIKMPEQRNTTRDPHMAVLLIKHISGSSNSRPKAEKLGRC